ncbi:MAG: BlaI/MecI/CopY family transcriptional regulator [Planctomycetota bacterium]
MARRQSAHPTELELQILKILWQRSPQPVREIRQTLAESGRDLAHTTVITTLGVMVDKKYVRRKRVANAFLFEPRVSQEATSEKMVNDLVDRVFDGSPSALMASLFNASDLDPEELKQLRRLINRKAKEESQ